MLRSSYLALRHFDAPLLSFASLDSSLNSFQFFGGAATQIPPGIWNARVALLSSSMLRKPF